MIRFVHKKHIEEKRDGKIVIYYNASDIFLGTVLLILVVFFINDYLSHTPTSKYNTNTLSNDAFVN